MNTKKRNEQKQTEHKKKGMKNMREGGKEERTQERMKTAE